MSKTFKVFLASSGELKSEREAIKNLIENYRDIHVKFEIKMWEDMSMSFKPNGIQEDIINPVLKESDVVILLFHSKAGKFTKEEFDIAYNGLQISKPKYMFFYYTDTTVDNYKLDTTDIEKMTDYMEVLQLIKYCKEKEQVPKKFNSIENLCNEIKNELIKVEKEEYNLDISDNESKEIETISLEEKSQENKSDMPKICIYTASPLNNNFEYKVGTIAHIFKNYKVEVFHKVLNEDNLLVHYDYDYNIIVSNTNKEKIIIEDEFFMQKSIQVSEFKDINNLTIFLNNIDEINNTLNLNIFTSDNKTVKKTLTGFAHKTFKNIKGKYKLHPLQTELPDLIDIKNLNNFVGRQTDIENLIKKVLTIKDENRILTIKGSGGLGKTTIISNIVIELAKRGKFIDGIKFVQCEFIKDYESFENKMTFAFDINNAINFKEQLKEQAKELEEDESRLIILDNVETLLHLDDTQEIKDLIRFISDYSTIIITSREILNENDYEEVYELKALSPDESEELFLDFYVPCDYDENSKESKKQLKIDLLENLLNYNPLAIKLVATNMLKGQTTSQIIEKLNTDFFEITKKDIEDMFSKESDTNIEKTYSLFGSINYSYNNLKAKEKLALEILSLFPDGLHITNLEAFYNKKEKNDKRNKEKIKHKFENFSDKDIKSLEDKSLVINSNGYINLQSIIGRFADFHFRKRDKEERISYYKKAFIYNDFVIFIIHRDIKSESRKALLFDGVKANVLKSLDYLKFLEYEEKHFSYLSRVLGDFAFTTIDQEIFLKLDNLKVNYQINETTKKLFDLLYLRLRYFNGEFDKVFKIFQEDYPIDDLIGKYNPKDYLSWEILSGIENIYSMEGYILETLQFSLENKSITLSELFWIGDYSLAYQLYKSNSYNKDSPFFEYEFLLNYKILETKNLKKYIKSIYKTQLIEKVQSTYTLLKADSEKVKPETINKLIVSNPFTDGLKILMKAIKDEKNCSKEMYEIAIEKLYHIKYYHVEAIYLYCKYLKEKNDDDLNKWFKQGKELSIKHHYRFLQHQFICLEKGEDVEYNEKDYPLPEKLDYSSIIKKYNLKGFEHE